MENIDLNVTKDVREEMMKAHEIKKIVIIGDRGVGKTRIIQRINDDDVDFNTMV